MKNTWDSQILQGKKEGTRWRGRETGISCGALVVIGEMLKLRQVAKKLYESLAIYNLLATFAVSIRQRVH